MDPMTAQLILRGVDLAAGLMIGAANLQEAQARINPVREQIADIDRKVAAGDITAEEGTRMIDALIAAVVEQRHTLAERL